MTSETARVGVGLLVADMDAMVHFYRDVLGLAPACVSEDYSEMKTVSGAVSLFMYSREKFVQAIGEAYLPPKGINQTMEIALWLPCFADVDAEYERLSKFDVPFPTGGPQTFFFGIRNFYVADPEGNLIEIGSMNEA